MMDRSNPHPTAQPGSSLHSLYQAFANLPLRAKLTSSFLVVTIIAIAMITYFTNRVTQSQLIDGVGANLKGNAVAQASAIAALLSEEINSLRAFGLNELLKASVSSANAAYTTDPVLIQSEIDKLDKQWMAVDANDPLIQAHITGVVADALRAYRNNFSGNAEVFITDKYGALVGASNRTSDYNQADEEWWQVAWNEGKGGVYLGEPALDESS